MICLSLSFLLFVLSPPVGLHACAGNVVGQKAPRRATVAIWGDSQLAGERKNASGNETRDRETEKMRKAGRKQTEGNKEPDAYTIDVVLTRARSEGTCLLLKHVVHSVGKQVRRSTKKKIQGEKHLRRSRALFRNISSII